MSMHEKAGHTRTGLWLALAAAIVSGVAVFVNAYGVRAVPDATVYTTAKNLVAATILIGLLAGDARLRRPPRVSASSVAGMVAVAVIGGSIPFVLFFEGLARASSSQTAFIQKTLVVWVALLAVPLLGERLGPLHFAAIGTLMVGQVVLAGGIDGLRFGTGEWLVLAATLLWAVEVVIARRLLRDLPADLVAAARMGGGVLLLLGWVAVSGRWHALSAMTPTAWAWAGLTGLILAAYVALWFTALALAPAVDVTAVLVVAAVITGALNAAVKGTAIGLTTGVGLAMVLAATALVFIAARRRGPVTMAA
jgi:drug/metabolite transporter (DMT)-like permease